MMWASIRPASPTSTAHSGTSTFGCRVGTSGNGRDPLILAITDHTHPALKESKISGPEPPEQRKTPRRPSRNLR